MTVINYLMFVLKFSYLKFNSVLESEFFSFTPAFTHHFHSNNLAPHAEGIFFIESLITLDKLIAKKRLKKQAPSIRFLVDMTGTAWFANETLLGVRAPKHFQMTGFHQKNASCLAAGNIKFTDSSCTTLKSINHQSGDFHPDFQSLKWILAILVLNEKILPFKLPKIIILKELDFKGKLQKKHYLRPSQIKSWIMKFEDNVELMRQLQYQDKPARIVRYMSPDNNLLNYEVTANSLV